METELNEKKKKDMEWVKSEECNEKQKKMSEKKLFAKSVRVSYMRNGYKVSHRTGTKRSSNVHHLTRVYTEPRQATCLQTFYA